MHVGHLRTKDFRNTTHGEIDFSDGIHIFHGHNGQGKTSILEAIYYLCLSKSFKTQDDASAVRFDQTFFDIEGRFCRTEHAGMETSVRVIVHRTDGKSVLVDRKRLDRFSELIGRFPAVVSAPEDVTTVAGAPGLRRRWLDMALSQIHLVYLKDLQAYRQALRQRNALLDSESLRRDSLDAWDDALAQHGTRVLAKRLEFVRSFASLVETVYRHLASPDEAVQLEYRTTIGPVPDDEKSLQRQFQDTLVQGRERDIQRRTTTVGPHKDDLVFLLNGRSIRDYGSQGQLKTFALALKLAEFLYVTDHLDEKPLLLLDDVFSELDWNRRNRLIQYLDRAGQVFLTSADYLPPFEVEKELKYYKVENAVVSEAKPEFA